MKIDNKSLRSKRYSYAGKIGSASRWKDHKKIETTFIRVYKDDASYITSLASSLGVSVGVLVHRFIQSLRPDQVASVSS